MPITSLSIYKDGWFLSLCILTLLVLLFNLIWALLNVKQTQIQIPVMAFLIGGANFALANLLHKKNRLLSIFLMMAALICAILASAILIGFTVINYGTT